MSMKRFGKALVLLMAVSGLAALCVAQTAQKPKFEVASIKPHLPSDRRPHALIVHGDRALVTNHTLKQLVLLAYSPRREPMLEPLLAGDPAWAATERFDIEAKASNDAITMEQLHLMLQALLADRFQLTLHRELREEPVYDLVVIKPGNMKLSEDQSPPVLPPLSPESNRGELRAWLLTRRVVGCVARQCRRPQSLHCYRRPWTDRLLTRRGWRACSICKCWS